jgi:hypothetical protein
MGVSWIFYTLMLCVMIPRVRLACIIIDQASLCLASMPTTLVLPIIQFCLTVGLYIYFCIVMFYLASAGKWNNDTHTFVWDYELQRIIVYHFFGLLWGTAFLQAVNNLTIAGAAADWFLADDKKGLSFPAINSLMRTLRYHLGTAAFGSFILAVVQLIRWIFRYYMYQLQKLDKQTGGFMKYPIACLTCIGECCLACLERFLDFINKNAYIQTAINGNNFCTAAKDACGLLIRNCLRVGTLQMVATVFTFLGKYFIALIVAIISAIWMVALDSGGSVSDGWANVSSAPVSLSFSPIPSLFLSYTSRLLRSLSLSRARALSHSPPPHTLRVYVCVYSKGLPKFKRLGRCWESVGNKLGLQSYCE